MRDGYGHSRLTSRFSRAEHQLGNPKAHSLFGRRLQPLVRLLKTHRSQLRATPICSVNVRVTCRVLCIKTTPPHSRTRICPLHVSNPCYIVRVCPAILSTIGSPKPKPPLSYRFPKRPSNTSPGGPPRRTLFLHPPLSGTGGGGGGVGFGGGGGGRLVGGKGPLFMSSDPSGRLGLADLKGFILALLP